MFVTRFGVTARANIRVMSAEVVAKEDAQHRKEQAKQKAAKINILFGSRIHKSAADHLFGGNSLLPPCPRKSSYKITMPFVTRILEQLSGSAVILSRHSEATADPATAFGVSALKAGSSYVEQLLPSDSVELPQNGAISRPTVITVLSTLSP
jgi:hypothetical protein